MSSWMASAADNGESAAAAAAATATATRAVLVPVAADHEATPKASHRRRRHCHHHHLHNHHHQKRRRAWMRSNQDFAAQSLSLSASPSASPSPSSSSSSASSCSSPSSCSTTSSILSPSASFASSWSHSHTALSNSSRTTKRKIIRLHKHKHKHKHTTLANHHHHHHRIEESHPSLPNPSPLTTAPRSPLLQTTPRFNCECECTDMSTISASFKQPTTIATPPTAVMNTPWSSQPNVNSNQHSDTMHHAPTARFLYKKTPPQPFTTLDRAGSEYTPETVPTTVDDAEADPDVYGHEEADQYQQDYEDDASLASIDRALFPSQDLVTNPNYALLDRHTMLKTPSAGILASPSAAGRRRRHPLDSSMMIEIRTTPISRRRHMDNHASTFLSAAPPTAPTSTTAKRRPHRSTRLLFDDHHTDHHHAQQCDQQHEDDSIDATSWGEDWRSLSSTAATTTSHSAKRQRAAARRASAPAMAAMSDAKMHHHRRSYQQQQQPQSQQQQQQHASSNDMIWKPLMHLSQTRMLIWVLCFIGLCSACMTLWTHHTMQRVPSQTDLNMTILFPTADSLRQAAAAAAAAGRPPQAGLRGHLLHQEQYGILVAALDKASIKTTQHQNGEEATTAIATKDLRDADDKKKHAEDHHHQHDPGHQPHDESKPHDDHHHHDDNKKEQHHHTEDRHHDHEASARAGDNHHDHHHHDEEKKKPAAGHETKAKIKQLAVQSRNRRGAVVRPRSPVVVDAKRHFEWQDRNMYYRRTADQHQHQPMPLVRSLATTRHRVVFVDGVAATRSAIPGRKIPIYPADFTDNTQLYAVLDSGDERIHTMERRVPLQDDVCVPMQEWQTTFYPSCNAMHEVDVAGLGGVEDETDLQLFGTAGYWRNAWKLERDLVDMKGNSSNSTTNSARRKDIIVLKTLKIHHRFEDAHFEHNRIDAIAMERLTASPHVINIFGFCGHSVMTEYADGKRLGELADKARSTANARLSIAWDIANGLADVHGIDGEDGTNATFVHLDINPANVVSIGGTLKLNDFNIGILRRWNVTANKPCGFPAQYPNPQWRSPEEARREQNLTEKVDVFSMGHIFFRLICGHEPWHKLEPGGRPSHEEVTEKVQRGVLPFIPQEILQSTDPEIEAIREAMLRCYTFDPTQRPSARQVADFLQNALDALS